MWNWSCLWAGGEKENTTIDYEVEGADYEVQRGTEGAGVGGSEEKNLVNLSRKYKYKVKKMMMGGSRQDFQTRKTCLWETAACLGDNQNC